MDNLLEHYYLKQPEPLQGCLLALKDIILHQDENITHRRLWQIPCFYYKDKKLSYLWVNKKKIQMGFIEDKNIYPKQKGVLLKDKTERLIIDPNADIPIEHIIKELRKKITLYQNCP